MEVFAKYVDASNQSNSNALLQLLASAGATTLTRGTGIDGANYSTNGITPFPFVGLITHSHDNTTAPKAYLNYLVFDRNYALVDGGYVQMQGGTTGREDGTNVKHDSLYQQITIKQPGYVYIYLSNESANQVEVYFDDFKVTQVKSPVVQSEDFYPFGLTFNSYQRENSLFNKYQYNGKELQNDLSVNWYDYGARMYMPEIGRFGAEDPHGDSYESWTPYNYVANNPILLIDPDGRDWNVDKTVDKNGKTNYAITFIAAIVNDSQTVTATDLVNLVITLINQIEDAFTMDEDNVSTSVDAQIRFAEDGKTREDEHVFKITDDLPENVKGKADPGSREIKINSGNVYKMAGDEKDKTTGPHEAGHSAGLFHPDEIAWYNVWSWPYWGQKIAAGQDNDNLMYSGPYTQSNLGQDRNNNGKKYKINAKQAEAIYENRDNKKKKK
jgi:RHS repeat-associated protein